MLFVACHFPHNFKQSIEQLDFNFNIFEVVNHQSDVIFQLVSDQSKVNKRVFMKYFQIFGYHCLFSGSSDGNKIDIKQIKNVTEVDQLMLTV